LQQEIPHTENSHSLKVKVGHEVKVYIVLVATALTLFIKTLFRRRHFQVNDADLNPFSSSSHIRISSSNCTFDTTVVLVVMFII